MAEVNQTVNINVKTKGTKKAEKDIQGVTKETAKLGKTGTRLNSMFGGIGTTLGRLVPTIGLATGAWKLLNDAIASSTQLTITYKAELAGFSTIYNDLVAGIADVIKSTEEADEATGSWAGTLIAGLGAAFRSPELIAYAARINQVVEDTRELLELQLAARSVGAERRTLRADIASSITELQNLDKTSLAYSEKLVQLNAELEEFANVTERLRLTELEGLRVAFEAGQFDQQEWNVRIDETNAKFRTLGRESEELVRQYNNFVRAQRAAIDQTVEQSNVITGVLNPALQEQLFIQDLLNEELFEQLETERQLQVVEGLRTNITQAQNNATRESIELEKEKNETLLGQLGIIAQLLSFIPGVGSFLAPFLSVFSTFNSIASVADVSTGSIFSAITRQRDFGGPLASQGLQQGVSVVLPVPDIAASLNNYNVQQTQSRL